MNQIIAIPESVLAFLQLKGWKLSETDEMHYILVHPDYSEPEVIKFHIPKNRQAIDFNFQINNLVTHIARLYKWDKVLLLLFLSMPSEEFDVLFQEWLRSQILSKKLRPISPTEALNPMPSTAS